MRKIIAKRLTESKATVPHFYTSIECEIDDLMALRKSLKKVNFDIISSMFKYCDEMRCIMTNGKSPTLTMKSSSTVL